MDHFREIKNNLTWHQEGKFEVELVNGIIKKLNFCEPGKGHEDTGRCLTSTNFKFLQAVHSALGDLFTFIEEENKRLGYSYSREDEIQPYNEEVIESTYLTPSETKLRPLINYDHQPETKLTGNNEALADDLSTQHDIELTA
jgi:hypothetical protein